MRRGKTVLFGVTIDYQLRYHDGLFRRLTGDGWKVHLVSAGDSTLDGYGVGDIEAHAVALSRAPSVWRDLRGLIEWVSVLRRLKPSVTVVGTPKAALIGGLAAWITRVPHRVYELHGLRLEGASGLKRTLLVVVEWVTCRLATEVIAVGASLAAVAVDAGVVEPSKVRVLGAGSPNGVDVEHFARARDDVPAIDSLRADLGLREGEPTIAFVGRLTRDKGLGLLASALPLVRSRFHLLVIGPVDGESAQELVKDIRVVASAATFVGEVADVAPYLAVSDVLCLPSLREGLPTVVLEALAGGVPVVATKATGIVDLIRDGDTGWLVPQKDARRLAAALDSAIAPNDHVQRVVESGFALVASQYDSTTVQGNWSEYLAHLWFSTSGGGPDPTRGDPRE